MDTSTIADIVVVGGGIAGMVAANRAAQLGLQVLLLEQGADEKYLCNSRLTGGTFHLCLRDITGEEAFLAQTIAEVTAGFVTPPLARMFAREGRRLVRWLQDDGIKFMRASGSEYHKYVLAPPTRISTRLDWEGRGGDVMLRTLGANLARRGGRIVRGSRARELVMRDGRCAGVIATQDHAQVRYDCRAVVLADGGFQGNHELVGRYISKHPERLKQRGAGTGLGDGLTMAITAGAAVCGMGRFYGHVLSRDAMTNDDLWPYPYGDSMAAAGIVVGADGCRFVDEGGGGTFIANAIATLADPFSAMVIFDQAIWEGPCRFGLIPANPHLPKAGGTIHQADDLATLAQAAGLPGASLAATVAAYNEKLAGADLRSLAPSRRALPHKPWPIGTPPYYAMPLCAGITHTMGGVVINEHAQALREDGTEIAGLYAIGATAGGLEGGPEIGYVGGLAKGGITGLRAVEHVAEGLAKKI